MGRLFVASKYFPKCEEFRIFSPEGEVRSEYEMNVNQTTHRRIMSGTFLKTLNHGKNVQGPSVEPSTKRHWESPLLPAQVLVPIAQAGVLSSDLSFCTERGCLSTDSVDVGATQWGGAAGWKSPRNHTLSAFSA